MASGIVESSNQGNESSQQGQQQQGQGSRSRIVQRLLDAAPDLPAFIKDLLTTQAVTVAGTEAAGFLVERTEEGLALRLIAHIRPDESTQEVRNAAIEAFQKIVGPCVAQEKDGAIEVSSGPMLDAESQYCLVTLLRADNQVVAASAVITRARGLDRAKERLVGMQLVAGYFELYTLKRNHEQSKLIAESHQHVLQLATAVATAEGFEAAAANLCNELATRSGAVRVSMGWIKNVNIKVVALSHTEQFDKRQELIVQLQNVMEECIDQEAITLFDPKPDGRSSGNVVRSAAKLSHEQGGHIVLCLPLRKQQADIVGAVCLEFLPNQKLTEQVAHSLNVAVDLLAPQLEDRYANDRWLITKAGLSMRDVAEKAIGPKYWLSKIIVAASIIAVLVLFNWIPFVDTRMTYHVTSPFQFTSLGKRMVCSPYDGQIKDVLVRPGQAVKTGDVLAEMDTSELQIKLLQARSEANAKQKEFEKNQYSNDNTKIADAGIALAQSEEAKARAELYASQIEKAKIRSPIDGYVIKGDLHDKKGAPVRNGDALMEVAPMADLQAELQVKERDIQRLKVGQTGKLATTSLPTERYTFSIDRIVPLGEARDSDNVFRVYATVTDPSATWTPGLQGEAKVDIEPKSIAYIWTHRLVDWVRLKLWI